MASSLNKELILSKAEAIAFLKYTLRIDDVDKKMSGPKLELLQEISRKFHEHIPFQNLTLLSNARDRRMPTAEEIKTDYFSGIGGVCYTSAVFAHQLLKTLGYETFLVAINVPSTEKPFTHAAIVVKDISSPGERFLVDLGAFYPTLEPVPLHFLPLYYKHAYLEYKFRRENGVVCRYHKAGNYFQLGKIVPQANDEGWQKYYEFEEVERDENFIRKCQGPVYTGCDYGTGWVTNGIKMAIYPNNAYTICELILKKWKKGRDIETVMLEDISDIEIAIRKYFPTLVDINLQNLKMSLETQQKVIEEGRRLFSQ